MELLFAVFAGIGLFAVACVTLVACLVVFKAMGWLENYEPPSSDWWMP